MTPTSENELLTADERAMAGRVLVNLQHDLSREWPKCGAIRLVNALRAEREQRVKLEERVRELTGERT